MPRKSTISSNTASEINSHWIISALDFGILSSVLILTCFVFLPSLSNGFVNWDDDVNLLNNPWLSEFSLDSIRGIFTSTILGNYNPLPILTFAIEHYFFGFNPFVFHFNNLILHLCGVGLVYGIANRVGCSGFGAGIAAAIFAIHPMHVESVAWVSQRKDLLFGLFFLAACFSYLKYISNGRKGYRITWIYLLFILSCLSKIQAVAFPFVMIGIDILMEKKWDWTLLKGKIGFLSISLFVGLGGIFALNSFGSLDATLFSFSERIAIGAFSFCMYIYKFFIPGTLSAVYSYPSEIPWYYFGSIIPFLAFLLLMYWSFKQEKKRLFFACWMFFVNIIFVLQFLGAGQAFLADRFSYLPYIGFAIGVGYLLNATIDRYPKWKLSLQCIPIFFLLFFSMQSFQQTKIWKESGTLWSHAIEQQPDLHIGFHNRGLFYSEQKKSEKALLDLTKAIELNPSKSNYFNSRAKVYVSNGQAKLALRDYNQAIHLLPYQADYYNHRSVAYAMLGRYSEAKQDLNIALEHNPSLAEAYLNRALIFAHTQQFREALQDNLRYLEYFPNAQEIWVEAGMNARMVGKKAAADQYLKRALSLNPNDSNAMEELALLK